MRFEGRMWKEGRLYVVDVPDLHVSTQGKSVADAFDMIADAIEGLIDKKGFRVTVQPGKTGAFTVESNDTRAFVALFLRQQRMKRGLSVREMAERLGSKSPTAYAKYEKGESVPSIVKLDELIRALDEGIAPVLKLA